MRRLPLLAMVLIAAPALAVGLGPLKKEGVTDGAAKGRRAVGAPRPFR